MIPVRKTLYSALALASSLLLGGCPLLPSPTAPAVASKPSALSVVQGNGQSAQAGRSLASPIVLRILDENGHGVPKQVASLVVSGGGGTVSPATVVSDSSGEVKLNWTLGTAGAVQSLDATVNGTIGVSVGATAIFPVAILMAQGALQSGKTAAVLKNDLVVRVVGPSNQPMVGIAVTFTVTSGGGAITPQSGATNALGELSAKWTMGAAIGLNTVAATSGTLPAVYVSAAAIP